MHRLSRLSSHVTALPCSAAVSSSDGVGREDHEDLAFQKYCEEGRARALALGNRGPITFDANGRVSAHILEAYWKCGFYVLEGVISEEELQEFRQELEALKENAPVTKGSALDNNGRPVKRPEIYGFVKPLSDPLGGTRFGVHNFAGGQTKGRHPIKMREHSAPPGTPDFIVENIGRPLANMDSALRVYGHPHLLRVAEALNGPDFTPFTENIFYKNAYLGTSTAWHQDPSSAWDEAWSKPGFDIGTCGFSFHLSLYNCTAENGLWVVPGTQHNGRSDVKALAALAGGSDRLPGAVPIICKPGDVYIQSRLVLHGAFPNRSPEPRCTFQFGFNRRASVLNVQTKGYGGAPKVYDEAYIRERSRMIALAIDARRQKYPHETHFEYLPFLGQMDQYRWSEQIKEDSYGCYWEKDIVV